MSPSISISTPILVIRIGGSLLGLFGLVWFRFFLECSCKVFLNWDILEYGFWDYGIGGIGRVFFFWKDRILRLEVWICMRPFRGII